MPHLGRIGEVARFPQRFLLCRTKGALLRVCGITHSPSTPQRYYAVKAIIGGREDGLEELFHAVAPRSPHLIGCGPDSCSCVCLDFTDFARSPLRFWSFTCASARISLGVGSDSHGVVLARLLGIPWSLLGVCSDFLESRTRVCSESLRVGSESVGLASCVYIPESS